MQVPEGKVCPLCGEIFSQLGYKLHLAFCHHQIKKIAEDHPSWLAEDGSCLLCMNLYRQEYDLPPLTREEFAAML